MDRIKESFDNLPIAACFFDKNGVVRLINRRMLKRFYLADDSKCLEVYRHL